MDKVTLAVVSRNYFNVPAWIGLAEGLFAAEGLSVRIDHIEGIEEVNDRLHDGRADLAYGVTEHVVLDVEAGRRQSIIGGNVNRLPFMLIARPGIETLGDLRGRRIGVSSVRAGSSSLIMKLLATEGLHYPRDYEIVPCGPILARWELLRAGEIDAGLQGAPLDRIALDQGFISLCNPRESVPDFQFTSLNVAGWAATNRDRLIRFLRAFIRAHERFYADPDAAARVAATEAGIERRYADLAWDEYTSAEIFPRDGRASIPAVQTLIETSTLVRELPSRESVRAENYIDHSWIEQAHRSF